MNGSNESVATEVDQLKFLYRSSKLMFWVTICAINGKCEMIC